MKPSDFLETPHGSKFHESHERIFAQMIEIAALRIMEILASTGDEWRLLQWPEYKAACEKEGNCPQEMQYFFNQAIAYTQSPTVAKMLSPVWAGQLCDDCLEAVKDG